MDDGGQVSFEDDPEGDGARIIFDEKFERVAGMLDDEISERVESIFGECTQWKCAVYHKRDGISQTTLVGNFDNDIPDPESIGKRCGGGKVRYLLRAKKGKQKLFQDFTIHLDQSYNLEAAKYKVDAEREIYSRQPVRGGDDSAAQALVGFATRSMEISATKPDNSLEMFRFFAEQQEKAEERTARILEKLTERKEPSLVDKIQEWKTLQELGLFGGNNDSKGMVTELVEILAPVAQTLIEVLLGRQAGSVAPPAQIEPPKDIVSLDSLAKEIVGNIDYWMETCFPVSTGNPLKDRAAKSKAELVKSRAKADPNVQALINSETHMRYILQNVGETRFAKLREILQ
jgi:hypothetical protein